MFQNFYSCETHFLDSGTHRICTQMTTSTKSLVFSVATVVGESLIYGALVLRPQCTDHEV